MKYCIGRLPSRRRVHASAAQIELPRGACPSARLAQGRFAASDLIAPCETTKARLTGIFVGSARLWPGLTGTSAQITTHPTLCKSAIHKKVCSIDLPPPHPRSWRTAPALAAFRPPGQLAGTSRSAMAERKSNDARVSPGKPMEFLGSSRKIRENMDLWGFRAARNFLLVFRGLGS